MKETVLRTVNLGKMYRIGGERAAYRTLRDAVVQTAKRPIERIRHPGAATHTSEMIWALKDVNIELGHGEVLGIIGPNGSGKSTLLKVLSHITEPTEGRAEMRGRVASLLEVGTGFHAELTGRENIQLNGAILGMSRAEIKNKFDEIVEFSEIGQFLDTPVKRYSSGMYVRLAFAVAAHLDPEILIVDEVLAVGDAEFQRKCLGRMGKVAHEGRTVLFVSHNMAAVRNLCGRVVQLSGGRVTRAGDPQEVTEAYLREGVLRADSLEDIGAAIGKLPPDPAFRLEGIVVRQNGHPGTAVRNGEPVEIEISYSVMERTRGLRVLFDLLDDDQNILLSSHHDDYAQSICTVEPGEYVSTAVIPPDLLAPRRYEVRIDARIGKGRWLTDNGVGIPITVEASNDINQVFHDWLRPRLQPRIPWQTVQLSGLSSDQAGNT
jgi:lipopolysaccharide transport system ATP-binding protein